VELQGKIAVVTGGTKGIGFAIAEALVRAGVSVCLSARHAGEINHAVAELNKIAPGLARGVVCDVRNYEQVKSLFARTASELGGIDILVNNAGIGVFTTVEEMMPADFQAVLETNLFGVFLLLPRSDSLDEATWRWLHHQHLIAGRRQSSSANGRLQRFEVWP